ncbi:kinase-like protein [Fomitiporia mediterranea MF3/22]|uniref:kinase-like protein n=1 Tax=Fomitiporia mediterranea (strain MF3/22) TaxID=694068 RepID=UPI0004407331|nr:kinase-like protein [Fomitiporia mediterranea MF3/22]EJD04727.1 kinase-like protein [Fomitiporia mediterranea MF3/22]
MDRLADDFTLVTNDLKVHKRAAGNIKEQLHIIARGQDGRKSNSLDLLRSPIKVVIPKLRVLSRLPPLQSYLRQGEVSDLLDLQHEACWVYVQSSNDEFMREDIETQREIYKADHNADLGNLKRLLRDCLRKNDLSQQLSRLSPQEVSALRSAINLELQSISDQASDSQAARLFKEVVLRLGVESTPGRNTKSIVQDLTGKIVRISQHPVAFGAICAVWTGELYGKRVALYSPSPYANKRHDTNVMKNAPVWASFDHPNVSPLLGICSDLEGNKTALVSRWMENGTIETFVRVNPGADRLKLISGMASGLAYLHNRYPPYIHGLFNGAAVLVNEEKQAIVGGFASATFERGWVVAVRWLAPESLDSASDQLTPASDVYSFAMTAYTVMTGTIPFDGIRQPGPIIDLLKKGERPARPDRKLVHHGLDDRLWDLIRRCWSQGPGNRPTMNEVCRELERMRELPVLDVRDLTGLITLPNDGLTGIRACGAFGDIRVGLLKDVGPVALKTLNIKGRTQPVLRHTKRFYREASIWNELKHPNVLPFLGTADPFGLTTCLVSPWMENGNLMEYMKTHAEESAIHIGVGITRGLEYLHVHKPNAVIHGDLRAANVLISNSGEPLLCDFGLAVIIEDLAQMPISSVLQDAGNPRWMAPELFVGEQQASISTASDIWALGMVFLEIVMLDVPYPELKSSAQVIVEVHKGGLPLRPTGEEVLRRGLSDDLWTLMMSCWEKSPGDRPSASAVLRELKV